MPTRRTYLRSACALGVASTIAGCAGNGSSTATPSPTPTVHEVAVGPEKRLRFRPEALEIGLGETVRWTAESTGHNVTSKPGASEKCENPDGAEPFANYEGTNHYALMEVGETYEYTFTVPGEYVYVCSPHADQGMVGSVTVTE